MDGTLQIADDTYLPTTPPASEQILHIEHCPFCLNNPVALGILPTAPVIALPALLSYQLVPALFYQAPYPLFAWLCAQPRAPPTLS